MFVKTQMFDTDNYVMFVKTETSVQMTPHVMPLAHVITHQAAMNVHVMMDMKRHREHV